MTINELFPQDLIKKDAILLEENDEPLRGYGDHLQD